MHYDFIAIPDLKIPQAVEPVFQHVVATYASETNKTVSMWRAVPDDLLDLLAVLAFDRGPSATGSHRTIRWRVHAPRADFGTEPARIPRDIEAGRWMERFTLERIN